MKEYIVTEHPEYPYEEPKPQELIRCKDCAWHSGTQFCTNFGLIGMYDDDFCSCAERKKK